MRSPSVISLKSIRRLINVEQGSDEQRTFVINIFFTRITTVMWPHRVLKLHDPMPSAEDIKIWIIGFEQTGSALKIEREWTKTIHVPENVSAITAVLLKSLTSLMYENMLSLNSSSRNLRRILHNDLVSHEIYFKGGERCLKRKSTGRDFGMLKN